LKELTKFLYRGSFENKNEI